MNSKKINYSKIIEKERELLFYKNLTLKILNFLKYNNKASFWEIVKYVGGTDRRVVRLLNEMIRLNLISFHRGQFVAKRPLAFSVNINDVLCKTCLGRVVKLPRKFNQLKKIMIKAYHEKPIPTLLFDQYPVNIETSINRALYLIWRGDLQNKNVALIGDDDLTSIALSYFNLAKRIAVFEIDKRLTNYLRYQAKNFKFKIEIIERDILEKVPNNYKHKFDVFIVDPTPLPTSFRICVGRGLQLLKIGAEKIGYLSLYPSGRKPIIQFQKILTNMNLIITDVIPLFTEYSCKPENYKDEDLKLFGKYFLTGAGLSFNESLMRVQTTEKTKISLKRITIKNILGEATQKILKKPCNDPAIYQCNNVKDIDYLLKVANRLSKQKNKIING